MRKYILTLIATIMVAFGVTGRQPERGYRAFIDANMSILPDLGFLVGDPGDSEILLGATTSHGYQFNPTLYVGGGAGFETNPGWKSYHGEDTHYVIPIFAEARADARWGRFTPFLSIRLGANVANHCGIYFSPIIGYRFRAGS